MKTIQTPNKDLDMPSNLSPDGKRAWAIINRFLVSQDRTYTGGCKAYYSPKEWAERGEEYGCKSILVVVYDGGELGPCFGLDHECYALHEAMRQALLNGGFWAEECTCWYSAIYIS